MEPLTILKYLALMIAAASAIWGLFRKLKEENKSQRRRVTGADLVTITLVLAGIVVSFVSNHYQEEQAARSAEIAARKEAQQKPLRNLTIEWTFDQVPHKLLEGAKSPEPSGPPGSECQNAWEAPRKSGTRGRLYTWLASLRTGRGHQRPVILLLSLDEAAANVLPLGRVSFRNAGNADNGPQTLRHNRLRNVAATIEFRENLEQCVDQTERRVAPPAIDRPRRCDVQADLKLNDSNATATWNLGPSCIANGIDRSDPSLPPTGELPARIVLLLLTEFGELPFEPANFAQSDNWLPWKLAAELEKKLAAKREKNPTSKRDKASRTEDFRKRSRFKLVANGVEADSALYDLNFHGFRLMEGKAGGAEVQHDYPFIGIWAGEKRQ